MTVRSTCFAPEAALPPFVAHPGLVPRRSSQLTPRFTLRRAWEVDRGALVRFWEQDATAHVELLAWLDQGELSLSSTYVVLADAGPASAPELLGACLVRDERVVTPVTAFAEVGRAFGQRLRRHGVGIEHLNGERAATGWLWETFSGRRPRLERLQSYYALAARPEVAEPVGLRAATLADEEPLLRATAAFYREEILQDPQVEAPVAFRRMMLGRIHRGHSWICVDEEGEVTFKVDAASLYAGGVVLSSVYTRPDRRGQGLARRALASLLTGPLAHMPRIVLYVNDHNAVARRLYERLGFQVHGLHRTLLAA